MAITFKFYSDAALTTLASVPLTFSQPEPTPTPEDVDQIAISIVDSASGSGSPATDIKLSLTLGGLASATSGAPLNLGTQVLSGTSNAKSIYIRVLDSTGTVGTNTDLSLQTNNVTES